MQWIQITREERDVLREEVKRWGPVFGDLQSMVEGKMSPDYSEEVPAHVRAGYAMTLLDWIGWEVDEYERSELPWRYEIIGFVEVARTDALKAIADLERRRLVAVCEAILSRDAYGTETLSRRH